MSDGIVAETSTADGIAAETSTADDSETEISQANGIVPRITRLTSYCSQEQLAFQSRWQTTRLR